MKFEMNSSEFVEFCAQLTNGSSALLVKALEAELQEKQDMLDSVIADREHYSNRVMQLNHDLDEVSREYGECNRELHKLRDQVVDLQDKLTPNRTERAYSRAFAHYLAGRKIMAVKEIRSLLNIGLKEAKDIVEGNFLDASHTLMYTLSQIFRDLGNVGFQTEQRSRLRSVVGDSVQTDDLNLILSGQFPSPGA